jgi:hypothetical protein
VYRDFVTHQILLFGGITPPSSSRAFSSASSRIWKPCAAVPLRTHSVRSAQSAFPVPAERPVKNRYFYAAGPGIFCFLALAQSTMISPLTVSIHIIVWLKRLKARGSRSAGHLSANLFRFFQLAALLGFQLEDFCFKRLLHHRRGQNFLFCERKR